MKRKEVSWRRAEHVSEVFSAFAAQAVIEFIQVSDPRQCQVKQKNCLAGSADPLYCEKFGVALLHRQITETKEAA